MLIKELTNKIYKKNNNTAIVRLPCSDCAPNEPLQSECCSRYNTQEYKNKKHGNYKKYYCHGLMMVILRQTERRKTTQNLLVLLHKQDVERKNTSINIEGR